MNRKGSLNLSIQAIVIVVIAFVVLGLGLGFVRNQFGSMEETSSSVQEQIKQQIMDDLRTGNKKLSFPAQTVTLEKGDAKDIAIGIKNTGNSDLNFNIEIETLKQQGDDTATAAGLLAQVEYFYLSGPFILKTTEAEAYNIKLIASGDKGTYLVRLRINNEDDLTSPYAEKSFYINVI
jgi:hypothetical protein